MHIRAMSKPRPAPAQIGAVLTTLTQILNVIMAVLAIVSGIEALAKRA